MAIRPIEQPTRPAAARILPSARPPVIDHGPLDRLEAQISQKRLRELLRAYLDAARASLGRIEAMAASEDLAGLAREAHDLKGLSGTFGAMLLQDLAQRLEAASRRGDLVAARDLTAGAPAVAAQTWALMESRLDAA